MMKRHFVILSMSKGSYDYDILLNYLRNHANVDRLSILPYGFLIKIFYEDDDTRRKMFKDIIKLDIENIALHEIWYEEFLPRKSHL